MSSAECAVLALVHDKLKPPAPLKDWTNIAPPGGFTKGACCNWQGVSCDGARETIISLYVGNASLSGTIPSEIATLTGLVQLNMFKNSLTGTIPPEFSRLINLKNLAFGINNLTGTIPDSLGQLKQLTAMYFDHNQISGTIPLSFQELSSLRLLYMAVNSISGIIPPEIGSLSSLQAFDFANNSLSGTVPTEIGSWKELNTLYLIGNQLSGVIPEQIYGFAGLKILALNGNSFSGTIPPNIGNLKSLTNLDLRSNSFTALPAEITSLSLSECKLEGNPYSCVPSLPSVCSRSELATASKCPEATGSWVNTRVGAVKAGELVAILASVIGVVSLIVIGAFFFRKRELSKRLNGQQSTAGKGKSTDGHQNNVSADSASTYTAGTMTSRMDAYLSQANSINSSSVNGKSMPILPGRPEPQHLPQTSQPNGHPPLPSQNADLHQPITSLQQPSGPYPHYYNSTAFNSPSNMFPVHSATENQQSVPSLAHQLDLSPIFPESRNNGALSDQSSAMSPTGETHHEFNKKYDTLYLSSHAADVNWNNREQPKSVGQESSKQAEDEGVLYLAQDVFHS